MVTKTKCSGWMLMGEFQKPTNNVPIAKDSDGSNILSNGGRLAHHLVEVVRESGLSD
ncbi:hypothetical protein DIREPILLOW8_76 [Vibrio phage Direpillow8]|uniref:Uncharacterized protein n=6 Tax=Thalassavirus TaxID=2948922 RepID=A0A6M4ES49_9CAUD|nr:hypothetical protein FDJ20_gp073 [Vibrio phage Thalassa]YP_010101847.1 hypothetical protein KNU52_gp068 [Vibrio phage Achelous]YP_010105664.1 hypothetical protein KNU87_gp071 [Vibrio phage Bennett]YP_010105859.1 hypothetical protein KNU88_gp073 [Vibrio phage Chester]YP_010108501.1 hypothetical protein KNV08_gp073 [Vibrio phage Quinn]YP_010114244.1 hypothetical protein KNV71_gp074 [Vibrio phage Gary]QIG66195.1 hypothetical protein CILSICK_74 [Vibrio phage Cilsick]QKN85515.1 hypothetical pr